MIYYNNIIYFIRSDGKEDWEVIGEHHLSRLKAEPKNPCNECIVSMLCKEQSTCSRRVDFVCEKVRQYKEEEKSDS